MPAATRPRAGTAVRAADAVTFALVFALVVAAGITGWWLNGYGRRVWALAPPLFAQWLPHAGPGTPLALAVAVLVVAYGPGLAARLPWPRVLASAYLAAVVWSLGLGLVDGWRRGLATRLTTTHEYLHDVPRVTDVPAALRGFTARILDFQPDSWTTHVAGHPPGALLVFVGLDRAGLGGGGWAAVLCLLASATTAVTVPATLRVLGARHAARVAVPFLVLFPGAVWFGASADAIFAAVTAAGLLLLATGAARGSRPAAAGGGAVLGAGVFLSYGLVLMALPALAVLVAARVDRARANATLTAGLAGAVAVVAAFALAGFWWLDGYHLVVERYYQGVASERSYGYWVWANLAGLVLSAGPAVVVMLRRSVVVMLRRPVAGRRPLWTAAFVLPLGGLAAIAVADLSGLSKAEVERIWLPFTVWLPAAAVALPGHRHGWLALQAATALAVNHLLLTNW